MSIGMTPPKKKMPQTVEECHYIMGLYGESMEADKEIIGLLKSKVNRLEQKITQYKAMYNAKQDY